MDITPEQARAELARRELARRGISIQGDQQPDWRGVVGSAVKEATFQPNTISRGMAGSDPVMQAKALPPLAGFAGGFSPIPGGATMGTVGGRQLSNMALRAYGRPEEIPSGMSQLGEAALSGLSDVIAIPMAKKAYYGRQIGNIEKAAGVPPPQDIPSIPMATGQKTTGEFINDAVRSVKSSGGRGAPEYWLSIKDQVDRLYKMGKDEVLTDLDRLRLRWLSSTVQEGLNAAVQGREIPAKALARSQKIPNAIGRGYRSLPREFKKGAAYGTGATAAGMSLYSLLKKVMGG